MRLPFGERRFSLFASVGFRQGTQSSAGLRSRTRMLPINAGFSYDYAVGESWRAYFGVAGSVIPFEHRAESELSETSVDYSVGGGGEGSLGFEWFGIFAEAAGGYTMIRSRELNPGPETLAQLVLGYRLGVF